MKKLPYLPVFDNSPLLDDLVHLPRLTPFGETVTGFVDAFSKRMFASPQVRRFPEMVALAFWMRRANLEKLRSHSISEEKERIFVPRGLAFHIAPSNVDSIFIYSWFISVLCGNSNIVRVSSNLSPQMELLFSVIETIFSEKEYESISKRSLIVQYGHDSEVNDLFSAVCDIRIVWGGDQTINEIRKSPLSPNASEMTFANKYSLCIIDVEHFLNADDEMVKMWIEAFYNDTYWFAQMACSSPRLILWNSGNKKNTDYARDRFWTLMEARTSKTDTGLDMSDYMNKRVAVDSLALHEAVNVEKMSNNDIVRVWIEKPLLYDEIHCGAGLFFETSIMGLNELIPLLSRKIQTITYIGIGQEQWKDFLINQNVTGIDRVVPVGKALDFDYIWDGYDMPNMFLREISVH